MKKIMIIAGEISGDLHGAALVSELKRIDGSLEIIGVGGDRMKDAGMKVIYHINKMAFLGFAEVVKHIPFIKRVQKDLIDIIREEKINLVVLIDYPGFNLNFAKKLKKTVPGVKIIYYISPQIWAWGKKRVKKIKKLINKMIVVFPFEKKFYEEADINVELVAHPLLKKINEYNFLTKEELYKKFNLNRSKEILLILPGSRNHEVELILPQTLRAAKIIGEEFNLQPVVAASPNIDKIIYDRLLQGNDFKLISGSTYNLMKYSKFGIIKSGTSTLEAALLNLPMLIVYKTGLITYLIGRTLIKIDNIGMANIILGEKIIPELIQNNVSADLIYMEAKKIISNKKLYDSIKNKLGLVKQKLQNEDSNESAAELIYASLNEAKKN